LATNNKREKFDLLINVLYKHAQTKADGSSTAT
jgi:hypothetical protein